MPGRRLISVSGALEFFDGLQRRKLQPGDDAALDERVSNRVVNTSDDTAEALLLTFSSSAYLDTVGERISEYAT